MELLYRFRASFGRRGFLAALLGGAVVAWSVPAFAASVRVSQIGGADRFLTAALIAQNAYPKGTQRAIVVSGAQANLVDALTAAPLSKALHAPILLSASPSTVGPETRAALARLGVRHIWLIGAAGAIPASQFSAGMTVTHRLVGSTRFATAALVERALAQATGHTAFTHAFVASAQNRHLVDALAAAPFAARQVAPILLAMPGQAGLAAGQADLLSTSGTVWGVGAAGTYRLSVPGNFRPLVGKTRYETATLLDTKFAGSHGYTGVAVANAGNSHLVDALAGAPWVGLHDWALVLAANAAKPPTSDAAFLQTSAAQSMARVVLLGGSASLPSTLAHAMVQSFAVHPTAAVLHISASPAEVTAGQAVTLSASGTNGTGATWSLTGNNAANGHLKVSGGKTVFTADVPGVYRLTATEGSIGAQTTVVVNGPPQPLYNVDLYAADSVDATNAQRVARAIGIPVGNVVQNYALAAKLVASGGNVVIAVGSPAVNALADNPCAWTSVASSRATPYPSGQGITLTLPHRFVDASGVTAANSSVLAQALASYAVSGHFPAGTVLPSVQAPAATCAGSATGATVAVGRHGILSGLDTSSSLAGAQVGSGTAYQFVARYLGGVCYPANRPVLTSTEVQALHADGVKIVSIYSGANHVPGSAVCGSQTRASGTQNGAQAVAEAKALGQPASTAIYLDVEPAQSGTQWLGYVKSWVTAVAAAGYLPGVYSGTRQLTVLEGQSWAKTPVRYWVAQWNYASLQTPPPDPTQAFADASLWQYAGNASGPKGSGGMVDLDSAVTSQGMW